MATNIGKVSWAKFKLNGENIIDTSGFRSIDFGSPSAYVFSVSGGKGAYGLIDDVETGLYREAYIEALVGSEVEEALRLLFESGNYGSENAIEFIKNANNSSVLRQTKYICKIRCVKGPGDITGFAVTGNDEQTAISRYPVEIELLSKVQI